MSGAAGDGHLHVVQWLRDNGCDWDEWACINAGTISIQIIYMLDSCGP